MYAQDNFVRRYSKTNNTLGTSPSANYRAALLGKSDKDFLNKLKMVEEELDETLHWLEIIMETEMMKPERLQDLHNECHELLKIIVSTNITMRNKINDKTLW